ncbi:MAG: O-antigen ligase family protein, partial [Candidatus Zixiibacteriota bacterium]
AVLLSWSFRYRPGIDKTGFDYNLWGLILATLISGLFAYNMTLSVVPIARIVVIYVAYRAFYYLSGVITPSRMLRFYINVYTVISLYHCYLFVSGGGALREFGVSGIAFETFCMVGVPVTMAYAIWSSTVKRRLIYSAFFLVNLAAAVATMSRGPLLTISVACPVLLAASFFKAKQLHISSARRFVKGFVLIIVPLAIIVIIGSGFFLQVGERFEELASEQPTGTVLLRLSLWKAAWQGFLLDPITGIGIGNFRLIDAYLPHLRFDPHRYYLVGMSFHNVFLQYLSETGLLGAAALLLLVWNVFMTGRRTMRDSDAGRDMAAVASVYICSFIFAITVFYMRAWTWGQEGYILALILALLVRQRKLSQKIVKS